MRVVFIGASSFGLRCLEAVRQCSGIEIVGIVTNPQTFRISYAPQGVTNVLYADMMGYAKKSGIPAYLMQKKMTEPALVEQVAAWKPELLLVVGWYHLVPRILRDIAPAAGLHASLLPDYSGGAPLVWAMINGEKKTGITFFMFDDGVDSGAIIAQAEEEIRPDDSIATLYHRIEEQGINILHKYLPRLADGSDVPMVQDESRRRIFPQRCPEDGEVDWCWDSVRVWNFVRAQTRPYPGAFTVFRDDRMKIWQVRVVDANPEEQSGWIYAESADFKVRCGQGTVEILELEYGKEVLNGRQFLEKFGGGGEILGG